MEQTAAFRNITLFMKPLKPGGKNSYALWQDTVQYSIKYSKLYCTGLAEKNWGAQQHVYEIFLADCKLLFEN